MKIDNVENYISDITEKVGILDNMLSDIIHEYSHSLDSIMLEIKSNILDIDNVPISQIETYFIKLSTEVYFMSSTVEKLGLFDSLSKAKAQETYNASYLKHQHSNDGIIGAKKPTVAEITAKAETDSLYDTTLSDVYSKAYKTIKNKISSAETMISTLSKILSHRMQESQLTTTQTTRQILNESNIF